MQQFNLFSEISEYQPRCPVGVDGDGKPKVLQVPDKVLEVRKMRKDHGITIDDYHKFFSQPRISAWLDAKCDADLYNRDSFLRLWEIYQSPRLTDPEKAAVVGKLAQFRRFINSNDRPVLALRLNFKDYPFDDLGQRQIDELNQQIGAFED